LAACCAVFVICRYGFNWGDGFITDAAKISQFRMADPRGFFQADNAANRNYKIVLAPHAYGEHAYALFLPEVGFEGLIEGLLST
jgi:hypothetical protein